MKKLFAYFNMIARHNFGAIMTTLVLLAAVNAVVFHLILGPSTGELSPVLDSLGLYVVFAATLFLLSVNLGGTLTDRGSHQNYFLARLRHRQMTLFWNQAVYNALCYGLLFAVEALSLLTMCMITVHRFPESYNAQSVMLACYQSNLLHTFLPLSDWLGWLTLGTIALSHGIADASISGKKRGGRTPLCGSATTGVIQTWLFFQWKEGALSLDNKVSYILVCAVMAFSSFMEVWRMEKNDDV